MFDASAKSRLAETRFGQVRHFESVNSTNTCLLELAREGADEGLVVVAGHQDAGRGRMDRSWSAPPGGSLLVSILLRPQLDADHLHLLTAVTAMAAADACEAVAGVRPQLKWPNDLIVGRRKLAGILAEADLSGGEVNAVVVGLGLNLAWPDPVPDELADIAITLSQAAGRLVDDPDAMLVEVLVGLEPRYAALATPAGRRAQTSDYRSRCSTLGQAVRVALPDETFTGTALDLSPEGHLFVDVGMCVRTVTAGDVVHIRPLA
ncbi:MAG: biotin--[acetyl-CoA-carboxylase] ligase [Acidimicrobiales bacterium]